MAKKYNYEELELLGDTSMHVQNTYESKYLDVVIDSNYKYKQTNIIAKILSFILYMIVVVFCPIILLVNNGVRIRGRRNLKNFKGGGVSICNHVLTTDSMCVAQAMFPRKVRFQSQEESFKIPGVRFMVKGLGAYPIPNGVNAKRNYIKYTDELLKNNQIVQIFPEGSLWPYYEKIRPFKPGAFKFAVKNNVPIIPMCINFRERCTFMKMLGVKAKGATLHIGKPIYPDTNLGFQEATKKLQQQSEEVIRKMNKYFKLVDTGNMVEKEIKLKEII